MTCQQVWSPFCHNFGHHFVTISATIVIRIMSVRRRLAPQSYRTFGQGHSMPSRLARKSYRTFGQGRKSYPVYTRTKLFLLGTAWRLSGSYRELPGGCPGIAGSCQEAVRELLGAADAAGRLSGTCRQLLAAAVKLSGRLPGAGREPAKGWELSWKLARPSWEPAGSLPGACREPAGACREAAGSLLGACLEPAGSLSGAGSRPGSLPGRPGTCWKAARVRKEFPLQESPRGSKRAQESPRQSKRLQEAPRGPKRPRTLRSPEQKHLYRCTSVDPCIFISLNISMLYMHGAKPTRSISKEAWQQGRTRRHGWSLFRSNFGHHFDENDVRSWNVVRTRAFSAVRSSNVVQKYGNLETDRGKMVRELQSEPKASRDPDPRRTFAFRYGYIHACITYTCFSKILAMQLLEKLDRHAFRVLLRSLGV